ncbi:MAG: response regulator [Actinomycetaceae bacterium]|nr:response regulator [Arcanobacterium sp.]MDD7504669.1 response regulator [Actinomycetaceae bacterium]MDY6143967.1 response regulator [Arcanobacterium sp.]
MAESNSELDSSLQEQTQQPGRADGAAESEHSHIRVLVVEDEALIRLDIAETLEVAGYTVVAQATNGEEAVEIARSIEPDLIVMDVKMPKKDGITAAREILEEQRCAIVMLTAYSQSDLVQGASDAGAMAYVVKPFTPADLLPAVEIAVSRYQEILSLEAEVENLTEQFETRKLVDRAKGLLQDHMGLTEPEAFRWIQKTSMNRRLSMREVADAVIEQMDK